MFTGENENWQDNTFLRSTFGEIPIIGPFFLEKELKKSVPKSIHSSFMLMGGVLIMVMDPLHLKPKTLGAEIGSGMAHMVLGMWLGGVAYHLTEYTSKKAANCLGLFSNHRNQEVDDEKVAFAKA